MAQPRSASGAALTHPEFVAAYRSGTIRVAIDPALAARHVSARLLLPLVMLPVLGAGVALALSGWLWTGFTLIAVGTVLPIVIRRSAPHFVLTQALADASFYDEVKRSGVLRIEGES